ncbi:MAG: EAL domain-containing protein, partial [Pelovirga sp.]
ALLRWQHPKLGMVSPGQFIPLAEETGLIVPIGTWVLEEACRQSLAWQAGGWPPIQIAVNLSARQFRQGDLAATVNAILSESGLNPSLLELELTESMIMDDPQGAEQALVALKNLGVSLSLDDFGTGYSSLNYLSRFPVDHLKIDQSFIRDIGTSAARTAVVSSIIDIAHNLQLTAIAEGVETSEQLAFLITNGCDAMQGYLFSKPLPADELARLLQQGSCLQDKVDGNSAEK